jgi:AAA domain
VKRTIFWAKIRTNNPVSIVGERRIGKSSLLNRLDYLCAEQLGHRRVVRFDFGSPEANNLEEFVLWLLGQLGIRLYDDDVAKKPNLVLSRGLRQFNLDNPPPIVFLDEFDKIQRMPDLFNDDFLNNLRSLCNKGHFCPITASKIPLREMIDKGDLTSPFWNVFTHTALGEFAVENGLDERALFFDHYWRGDLTPTDEERAFLHSYDTAHPLKLQIISSNLCQNRYLPPLAKRSDAQMRALIEDQYSHHFYEK